MISSRRRIYGDDHEAFRESVKRFIATEVAPNLDQWRGANGAPRSIVCAAGEAGFLSTAVPEEFGGGGTDDLGFLVVLIEETIAAGATGLALLWALQAGVTIPLLLEHASAADKQRWLPGLGSGQLIAVPAPATLSSVAAARIADALLVHNDSDGIALVPLDQPRVTVTPIDENLAGRDAGLADVTLGDVGTRVDLAATTALHRDLDLWFAVLALASARAAMTLALDYVHARKVFGRPLAEFENTRFRLAELRAELARADGVRRLLRAAARCRCARCRRRGGCSPHRQQGVWSGGRPVPAAAWWIWIHARIPDLPRLRRCALPSGGGLGLFRSPRNAGIDERVGCYVAVANT